MSSMTDSSQPAGMNRPVVSVLMTSLSSPMCGPACSEVVAQGDVVAVVAVPGQLDRRLAPHALETARAQPFHDRQCRAYGLLVVVAGVLEHQRPVVPVDRALEPLEAGDRR